MIALRAAVEDAAERLQMRISLVEIDGSEEVGGSADVVVAIDGTEYILMASQPYEEDDVFSLHISTSVGDTEEGWEELLAVGDAIADWLQLEQEGPEAVSAPTGPEEVATITCKIHLSLDAKGGSASRTSKLSMPIRGRFSDETAMDELIRAERRIAFAVEGTTPATDDDEDDEDDEDDDGDDTPSGPDDETIFAWLDAHPAWEIEKEASEVQTTFTVDPGEDEPLVCLYLEDDAVEARIWLHATDVDPAAAIAASTEDLTRSRIGFSAKAGMWFIEAHMRRELLTRDILEEELAAIVAEAHAVTERLG
ncbi:MAG: hypothetical protein JST00_11940 [Deltaproteobacteria bacterium]|nr:hypothetical protein [Deltaproteobacteria bacterium]